MKNSNLASHIAGGAWHQLSAEAAGESTNIWHLPRTIVHPARKLVELAAPPLFVQSMIQGHLLRPARQEDKLRPQEKIRDYLEIFPRRRTPHPPPHPFYVPLVPKKIWGDL